jgi:hypothetical protein
MSSKIKKDDTPKADFALGRTNYYLILVGVAIILIGFVLMVGGRSQDPNVFNENEIFSFRRVTVAPIIVVIGFVFEIYAIMKKPKD